jgi:hypothetical protein
VRESVHIPRSKNKTPTQLKWIQPKSVLPVPLGSRTLPALEIIRSQNVQDVRHSQIRYAVRLPLFVNQQREVDSRLFLENSRIIPVPQADCRQTRPFFPESLLVFAQLRDVLAAEDSSIVPQKHHHRWLPLPQRSQTKLLAKRIRQHNPGQLFAQSFHDDSSLKNAIPLSTHPPATEA